MENYSFSKNSEIDLMRQLISKLEIELSITDFEEAIQIQSIQQSTRLWTEGNTLIAFSYVDDFNNLCFEIAQDTANPNLELEIAAWGETCMREKNRQSGKNASLDSSCSATNLQRIHMLERMGFIQQSVRSMRFIRTLATPIQLLHLPQGFYIRTVYGESEVEQLVDLHRAAFGTQNMTVEYRLAMMHTPGYDQAMDWLVTSSDSSPVAFCIGSIDEKDSTFGSLDPIGTHPAYRRLGLSSALINHGLTFLKNRGVHFAQFGTSSENIPMQQLANHLDFKLKSESVWFSKEVK